MSQDRTNITHWGNGGTGSVRRSQLHCIYHIPAQQGRLLALPPGMGLLLPLARLPGKLVVDHCLSWPTLN